MLHTTSLSARRPGKLPPGAFVDDILQELRERRRRAEAAKRLALRELQTALADAREETGAERASMRRCVDDALEAARAADLTFLQHDWLLNAAFAAHSHGKVS